MSEIARTIAILGMHRSGTSALTGSLEQAGVYIGETSNPATDNAKGYRESLAILALHEDLLQRNGGSWDRPVRNMQWQPVHRALQTSIIQNFDGHKIWGFKDPRTLLTTKIWLKSIPTLEFVGIFRHPFLVADSLIRRNHKTADEALDLWFIYNTSLLWLLNNHKPFPVLEFTDSADQLTLQLNTLIDAMGLNRTTNDFFSDDLRNKELPEIPHSQISNRCLKLYESLQQFRMDNSAFTRKAG